MRSTVVKTRCLVSRAGKVVGQFDCDTIFINRVPHVVFEWEYREDGSEVPIHLVPLDPQYFHPLPGWQGVQYMYEFPVTDPLSLS